ncbi:response regulator transcription factor [Neobacillus vireti]|uniref:Two-component response regulator n=1 Tax=Neobacillus vireti LMG 21834 TaxID=1131730 RepID=A0AB94IT11_9BACI|nr:response regulator transcription factor [Neobacillus vireti]ETI70127.1 two-component response regulator [Neobacillus vireti LMG 21834]KLT16493.1 transcriptional regulator [Neobacillus vireti]
MYKIMLIEDDRELCSLVKEYLEKYKYMVYEPTDFNSILEQFEQVQPDLVLLDINLPYFDGFYLCRAMRKKSKVPIIITSARSGELDQVMAIELGADDYLTKPFTFEVLLAKVKAALRRAYGEYSTNNTSHLTVQQLTLYEDSFKMTFNEKIVELSKNEYKLVKYFIENKDRIITREELIEQLWDDIAFVDDNTLTVNISRIKNKFLQLGIKGLIQTKRSVGYLFNHQLLAEVDGDE